MHAGRQADRQTERQTDNRETGRQTDMYNERHTKRTYMHTMFMCLSKPSTTPSQNPRTPLKRRINTRTRKRSFLALASRLKGPVRSSGKKKIAGKIETDCVDKNNNEFHYFPTPLSPRQQRVSNSRNQ